MNILALLLQSAGAQQTIFQFVMIGGVFAIFYLLVILPANKQKRKTQEMLNSLKKGDRVVTSGGIYGTVQGVEPEVIYLKIADNVRVKVARSAITGVLTGESEQ